MTGGLLIFLRVQPACSIYQSTLTLSLTGVGPFGHTPLKMLNTLKVLKARCCQKLAIPQVLSYPYFKITILPNFALIRLLLIVSPPILEL